MTNLLLLATIIVSLAALGRIVIPRTERLPWWTRTCQDLTANVAPAPGAMPSSRRRRS